MYFMLIRALGRIVISNNNMGVGAEEVHIKVILFRDLAFKFIWRTFLNKKNTSFALLLLGNKKYAIFSQYCCMFTIYRFSNIKGPITNIQQQQSVSTPCINVASGTADTSHITGSSHSISEHSVGIEKLSSLGWWKNCPINSSAAQYPSSSSSRRLSSLYRDLFRDLLYPQCALDSPTFKIYTLTSF